MEHWELLVQQYPDQPSLRGYSNAVENAKVIFKQDLAPFEIEYALQTLLRKPVCLLSTLTTHYASEDWMSIASKSFDLLMYIIEHYGSDINEFLEDIIKACSCSYSPSVRRRALNCLREVCSVPAAPLDVAARAAVAALGGAEGGLAVRAARAGVVGAICEHRPELIADNSDEVIWRTCLNILETNKTGTTLINGVLSCLEGLFKHFGVKLPTAELNKFYESLSTQYIQLPNCQESCLNILRQYTRLFPERVTSDVRLRSHLWSLVPKAADALVAVYDTAVTMDNARDTISNELYHRTQSRSPQERNTACRIVAAILKKYGRNLSDISRIFEKQASSICTRLEFGLETKMAAMIDGNTEYDQDLMNLMDEASWCIDTDVPGSDVILRTMILLHSSIPSNRKRKLLTHKILKANNSLRSAAVTFIITESLQTPETDLPKLDNINKYFSLWRNMFESNKGTDTVVLDNCMKVVDDFVNYLISVVDVFLDECGQDVWATKERISILFTLASQIITLENARERITAYSAAILERCFDVRANFGVTDGLLAFLSNLVSVLDENRMFENGDLGEDVVEKLKKFYQTLDINRCDEESVLCASCLALIEVPDVLYSDTERVLDALEFIFERNDVEAKTLSKAVQRLDSMLQKLAGDVTSRHLNVISSVQKLRGRKDLSGKEGRVLQRDVVLFLGKYGSLTDVNNNERSHGDLIVQLQGHLTLSVTNMADRSLIKINLNSVLDAALTHEEPAALHTLLLILSAHLSNRRDPLLQKSLLLIIYKLSRCHGRGEAADVDSLLAAVTLCDRCDGVMDFVSYISKEKSPGVRKILSNVLEEFLLRDPHSESTAVALRRLVERVTLLLDGDTYATKRAGLDMIETVTSALKENNALTVESMPSIIKAILTVEDNFDALKIAAQLFIDKILLYPKEDMSQFQMDVLEKVNSIVYGGESLRRTLSLSMEIVRAVFDYLNFEKERFVSYLAEIDVNCLNGGVKYVILLTESKRIFNFDGDFCRKLINLKEFLVLDLMKKIIDVRTENEYFVFNIEVAFDFLKEYAEELLEVKYQETISLLNSIINKLQPEVIKPMKKRIKSCFQTYEAIWKTTPSAILKNMEKWWTRILLNDIINNIKNKNIQTFDETSIKSLLTLLSAIKLNTLPIEMQRLKEIPKTMLDLQKTGDIEYYMKSKMDYLTDVLNLTLTFLNSNEIEAVIVTGHSSGEMLGVEFVRLFVSSFAEVLMKNNVKVLDDLDGVICYEVFNDVLVYYGRRKTNEKICNDIVVKLLKIWPSIEDLPFANVHTILANLSKIEHMCVDLSSPIGRWWLRKMAAGDADEKVKLMRVLPLFAKSGVGDDVASEFELSLSSYVSTCGLGAVEIPASSRAVLAVSPAFTHTTMLRLMVACVVAEEIPEWLETATSASISRVAVNQDPAILTALQSICDTHELSVPMYERILMPAIRHSSIQTCEKYFAKSLPEVVKTLNRKSRAETEVAKSMYLVQCGRAFNVAQAAFDKLPELMLETPSSPIFANLQLIRSKNLAQELCKLCVTLRSVAKDGDEKICRYVQQSNFNCLASVLLKTKPALKFFKQLLNEDVYASIVDDRKQYDLYIQGLGRSRVRRHLVTSDAVTSSLCSLTVGSVSATTRTLLTCELSDNPFQYDFNSENEVVEVQTQSLLLKDNQFNSHPCMVLLCASICHVVGRDKEYNWLGADGELRRASKNVRWLLAQVIINCKEELKVTASTLVPVLLAIVADTPEEFEGKEFLNGLHIDILNTTSFWYQQGNLNVLSIEDSKLHINTILKHLIRTCIHHKKRISVFKAVLNTLSEFTSIFKQYLSVEWNIFEELLVDKSNEIPCLDILLALSKNKLYIPKLTETLLSKFNTKQTLGNGLSNMSQLFGLAMASCHDNTERLTALSIFRKLLDRLRREQCQDYVKVLYYAQNGLPECCDEMNFRHITNLTNKMLREMKKKCFDILATYIEHLKLTNDHVTSMYDIVNVCEVVTSEHTLYGMKLVKCGLRLMEESLKRRSVFLVGTYCGNPDVKVRKMAADVMIEAAEELFATKGEPSAKRMKLDYQSCILQLLNEDDLYIKSVLAKLGTAMADSDSDVRETAFGYLAKKLNSEDMGVRFCECVLICMYLPAMTSSATDQSQAGDPATPLAAILKLFYIGVTSQRGFDRLLLRDEPIQSAQESSNSSASTKLLTMSRAYQGTFRNMFTTAGTARRKVKRNVDAEKRLNVQIPMIEVINSLLCFAESTPQAASAIFRSTLSQLASCQSSVNLSVCLSEILTRALARQRAGHLSVALVDSCRAVVRQCCLVEGFQENVKKLYEESRGTEMECPTRLLYEEVTLYRSDYSMFQIGKTAPNSDEPMEEEYTDFSIEDLVSAFGKLSNWDALTSEGRRRMRNAKLPQFWTDHVAFEEAVNKFTDNESYPTWVSIMKRSLERDSNAAMQYQWLRQLDHWPRRPFHISAVTEAIQWRYLKTSDDLKKLPSCIKSTDCMAEWALRLMFRSQFTKNIVQGVDSKSLSQEDWGKRSRAHELVWCEESNRRGLPALTLQCVKRNMGDLQESEVLPWLYQQANALRIQAQDMTGSSRCDLLNKAIDKLETFAPNYVKFSTPDVATDLCKLNLLLNRDNSRLNRDIIHRVLSDTTRCVNDGMSGNTRDNMSSIYELVLYYYDGLLEASVDDAEEREGIIDEFIDCFQRLVQYNVRDVDSFTCMVLERMNKDNVSELLVKKFLDLTRTITLKLDTTTKTCLASFRNKTSTVESTATVVSTVACKMQLLCDPAHTLTQYCGLLSHALKDDDEAKWREAHASIRSLLENPFAGTAYQLLNKYKPSLYEISEYDNTKQYRDKCKNILRDTMSQLTQSEYKTTLNLLDLCPSLARDFSAECEGDGDSLCELLNLPAGVRVVKFDKELKVYQTLRRPCILSASLSNGHVTRYLVKRGEPLAVDAATSQAIVDLGMDSYKVTPLGPDSGIIEFLEGHVTVRSMIMRKYNLDEIMSSARETHVLSSAARAQFDTLCQALPATALREVIQEDCATMQDFLFRQKNFQKSLADMTVIHWVLGVYDRHLNNVLYSVCKGGLCGVDLSAVSVTEPLPARCTRCMIAVCSQSSILECGVQTALRRVRAASARLIPTLRVRYRAVPSHCIPDFDYKMTHISDILRGLSLSWHTTSRAMSRHKMAAECGQVLELVFRDVPEKDIYTVEEQSWALLRHCTSRRVLSATRRGWEPWA